MQSVTNHITQRALQGWEGKGKLEVVAGISGAAAAPTWRKLNFKLWFEQVLKADLVTDEAKNDIFMLIDIVAKGSMLRLYLQRL